MVSTSVGSFDEREERDKTAFQLPQFPPELDRFCEETRGFSKIRPQGNQGVPEATLFRLFGGKELHRARSKRAMLRFVIDRMYDLYPKALEEDSLLREGLLKYFGLSKPKSSFYQFGDTGYYARTELDRKATIQRARRIMAAFGFDEDDLVILD